MLLLLSHIEVELSPLPVIILLPSGEIAIECELLHIILLDLIKKFLIFKIINDLNYKNYYTI